MSYPEKPLTAQIVREVLKELNYMYPMVFCKTLAGKLNERLANQVELKDCPVCDGWGSVSTGIDEAPSTLCKACDGNGSLPK